MHLLRAGVNFTPPKISMATARKEAEMVLFESVSEALRETNMHPRQVLPPLSDACGICSQGIPASSKIRTPQKKWLAYCFYKMKSTVRCRALGMGHNSNVPIPYSSHRIAGAGRQKSEGGCLHAAQVDILIVNCSLFNPTPSLSAMVVNHFGMRPDIKSYNLSGMGCSAGIISIGLARELLQVHMLT